MNIETEQEQFWKGNFGNEYLTRNGGSLYVNSSINQFTEILKDTENIISALELGANIGNNIEALHKLVPAINLEGIEINAKAASILTNKNICKVHNCSISDFKSNSLFDITFTCGVLIHLNPSILQKAYETLYDYSKKYILINEYYNPDPVEIKYRGHEKRLYKRDFAGELLSKYKDLSLVNYGFFYNRDEKFKVATNTNWFLLKKP